MSSKYFEDDILPAKFKAGTMVLLQGDNVEAYVRSRRTELPGEVIVGETYAEYHVDDDALYQMILDTFYVK